MLPTPALRVKRLPNWNGIAQPTHEIGCDGLVASDRGRPQAVDVERATHEVAVAAALERDPGVVVKERLEGHRDVQPGGRLGENVAQDRHGPSRRDKASGLRLATCAEPSPLTSSALPAR